MAGSRFDRVLAALQGRETTGRVIINPAREYERLLEAYHDERKAHRRERDRANRAEDRGRQSGAGHIDPRGHFTYVHRDVDGHSLYVGASSNLMPRQGAHARTAVWWPRVARIDLERFETRNDALAFEAQLIRDWQPPFNVNRSNGVLPADEQVA